MARQYDLIVFDWDGTLMDSTAHIAHAIQNACKELELPIPSKTQARYVIGLGLAEAMSHTCPELPPERYQEMVAAYRKYYLTNESVELFDGVKEGLASLKDTGAQLAVATGKSRAGLNRVLRETELGQYFDSTRTVDECHSKPHPDMLEQLTDELGADPQRTLMIGDTSHDLQMAINARTHSVGVSYGAHSLAELEACQPVQIFDSFINLHSWLLPRLV